VALESLKITNGLKYLSDFQLQIPDLNLSSGLALIIGANGSGKTTIARIATNSIRLDSGDFANFNATSIGYVPQQYRDCLFPWMSAQKNISALGINTETAMSWCERLGISRHDLSKMPRHLSGGQCQKIVLVRECLYTKKLLVLDEPFSSLDSSSIAIATQLLENLLQTGVVILLISHIELPSELLQYVSQKYTVRRKSDTEAECS